MSNESNKVTKKKKNLTKKQKTIRAFCIGGAVIIILLIVQVAVNPCDYFGHKLVHHKAKAATCAEKGWEAYDTCERCDYSTYKKIGKLPHDWGKWKITLKATYDRPGVKEHKCKKCGKVEEKTIPKKVKPTEASSADDYDYDDFDYDADNDVNISHYDICYFIIGRQEAYALEGGYDGDGYHDSFAEAQSHFGITYDQVYEAWTDYDANMQAMDDYY